MSSSIDNLQIGAPEKDNGYSKDIALARRIADGDQEAEAEFYERVRSKAMGVALRLMSGKHADAEDAFHDAWVNFVQKVSYYQGRAALSSYFIRGVINECLMKMRRDKKFHNPGTDSATARENEDRYLSWLNSGDGVQWDDRMNTQIDVSAILKDLPKGYRQAILLHDAIGLEHLEIAGIREVHEGTSKSQLSKARAIFRRRYSRTTDPD